MKALRIINPAPRRGKVGKNEAAIRTLPVVRHYKFRVLIAEIDGYQRAMRSSSIAIRRCEATAFSWKTSTVSWEEGGAGVVGARRPNNG
jgi:hypothetical protein